MRASDPDREFAAEMLRDAYAVGRLDLDEFHERTGAAYSATTWGELRGLTADLPDRQVLARSGRDVGRSRGAAARRHASRCLFAPIWIMAALLLAIAAGAHLIAAAISLIVLALLVHCVAGWNPRPAPPPAAVQPEWMAPESGSPGETGCHSQHAAVGPPGDPVCGTTTVWGTARDEGGGRPQQAA